MQYKVYTTLLLFLIAVQLCYGQQNNNQEKSYLVIKTAGLSSGEIKQTQHGNITKVIISGGYVSLRLSDFFKKSAVGVYYNAYYDNHNNPADTAAKPTIIPEFDNDPFYLVPSQEFLIDFLTINTHQLVKRYIIRRAQLIPQIKFYHQSEINSNAFYTSPTNGQNGDIEVSAGKKIVVKINERKDFKNIEAEYSLRN